MLLKITLVFVILVIFVPILVTTVEEEGHLQILLMRQPDRCPIKSSPGDLVHVHFMVSL